MTPPAVGVSSRVVDEPADALIRAVPQIDDGGGQQELEVPGDRSTFLERLIARRARSLAGDVVFLDDVVTGVAPGHGWSQPRSRTRILMGVGPRANSSRSFRSTYRM